VCFILSGYVSFLNIYFKPFFLKNHLFLSASDNGKRTAFWTYLVGSLFIIAFASIGQLPFTFLVKREMQGSQLLKTQQELMHVLPANWTFFLVMLSFAVAFFGSILVLRKWHQRSFLSVLTSRKHFDFSRFFYAFGLYGTFLVGMTFLQYHLEPSLFVFNFDPVAFGVLLVLAVLFIPLQAAVEELVFRGYLMQGFYTLSKKPLFALVMTSLIFGCLHLTNPEFSRYGLVLLTTYVGTGFFLGLLSLCDQGTELAVGFHTVNNFIGCVLVSSDWSALPTPALLKDVSEHSNANVGLEVLFPLLVMYPVLFWIFSRKYAWKHWKQRIF